MDIQRPAIVHVVAVNSSITASFVGQDALPSRHPPIPHGVIHRRPRRRLKRVALVVTLREAHGIGASFRVVLVTPAVVVAVATEIRLSVGCIVPLSALFALPQEAVGCLRVLVEVLPIEDFFALEAFLHIRTARPHR